MRTTEGPTDIASTVSDRCNTADLVLDHRIEHTNKIAYSIIAPIIISVGMIGNLLTIFILRLPQFRGVTYLYFFALASSDFISLLFSISVVVHHTHKTTTSYSTVVWYSYFEIFFANVFLSTSVYIVMCVTIERFYSVCWPKRFKVIHTCPYAKKLILCGLFMSVVVWFPMCFTKTPREHDNCDCSYPGALDQRDLERANRTTLWVSCMEIPQIPTEEWYYIYSWVRQTLATFLPSVLLVVLNSLTLRGFVRMKRKRRAWIGKTVCMATSDQSVQQAIERKYQNDSNLINLLTAVMISFSITMIPVGVCNAVYSDANFNDFHHQLFRAISNNLEILNHAMNFYMYALYCKPVRAALRELLGLI